LLRQYENEGDFTARLALQEELKGAPWSAIWDYYCLQQGVPVGIAFMDEIKRYEEMTLAKRG
jgi:L-rhamnose isomerase